MNTFLWSLYLIFSCQLTIKHVAYNSWDILMGVLVCTISYIYIYVHILLAFIIQLSTVEHLRNDGSLTHDCLHWIICRSAITFDIFWVGRMCDRQRVFWSDMQSQVLAYSTFDAASIFLNRYYFSLVNYSQSRNFILCYNLQALYTYSELTPLQNYTYLICMVSLHTIPK